jgi:hypothetical protein
MRFLRENSLSIAFGLLFLASLFGQSVAGWYQENELMRVYLRQRGSPESKPVGSRHDETGAQG